MKFSRSFIGYTPVEVNREKNQIKERFSNEEKEILLEFDEVVSKHGQLFSQYTAFSAKLEVARSSMILIDKYKKVFSNTMLSKAQMDEHFRIEEINREREDFILKIEENMPQLENDLNNVKANISSATKAIYHIIHSINSDELLDKKISCIDDLIKEFTSQAQESCVETQYTSKTTDVVSNLLPIMLLNENFQLDLEKVSDTNIDSSYTEVSAGSDNIHASNFEKPVVLIAENDKETASLLKNIMEREGFEVIMAIDGYELSNILKEKDPPGVLLLSTLFEGSQLIKQVRSNQKWQDVPIIALTSEHSKQSIIEVLEYGANDSIEKPFNPRELVARVKRLSSSSKKY